MNERLMEDVRRLIDGELDPAEVHSVLYEIADDAEARALLHMEFRVRHAFDEDASEAVPADFADRVMERVLERPAVADRLAADRPTWTDRLQQLLETLLMPQPVMLRPVYALAVALVVAAGIVLALPGEPATPPEFADSGVVDPMQQVADRPVGDVLVRFVYMNSQASSVSVAGDFNGWEPTRLERQEVDGRVAWTGLLPVAPGEHRYMFVVDGETWVSDPLAPVHRDDGFGNSNAILTL